MPEAVTVALITGVSSLLTLGGVEMIKAVGTRRPRQAVAVESEVALAKQAAAQADQSAKYAQQMEEDARQARERANSAWQKANAAEAKANRVDRELEDVKYGLGVVSRYLTWLLDLIGEPSMDIQRLRREVEDRKPPVTVGGQQ